MTNVDRALLTAVKTGKVLFGARSAVKSAKIGKAKLIVIASNCPKGVREDIEYYCKLSEIPILTYGGTSADLGMACGKPFSISALTIKALGESDILDVIDLKEATSRGFEG